MAGKVASLLLQLASFACLTRLLGASRFGDLAAGLAAVGMLAAIAEFGLTATLVVQLSRTHSPRELLRAGRLASAISGAVGLVVVALAVYLLFPPRSRLSFWVLLPSSAVELASIVLLAYWQYRLSFGRLARAAVSGQAAAAASLGVLLLAGRRWDETIQLLAVGSCLLLAALVTLALLRPPGLGPPERQSLADQLSGARAVLVGALPVGFAGSLSLVHMRADQVVLATLGYRRALASYAVAYQVVQGVVVGLGTVGVVGFTLMARGGEGERAGHSRRAVALLCVLGVLGAFGVVQLSPVAVEVLGGRHYTGAVRACRLLAPVVMLSVANTMAGRVLIVAGRARLLGAVAGSALALNVALCLVLVPRLGIAGAATATVASEALGVLLVVVFAERALATSQPILLLLWSILGTTASVLVADWVPHGAPLALGMGALTLLGTSWLSWIAWDRRGARSVGRRTVGQPGT